MTRTIRMPRLTCACCGKPYGKMLACVVCGESSHPRCLQGRLCVCESSSLTNDSKSIAQTKLIFHLATDTSCGGRHALVDMRYDKSAGCLLLQATKPGLTIRITSAGVIMRGGQTRAVLEERWLNCFWRSPRDDLYEWILEPQHFYIRADTAAGVVDVAASNKCVVVLHLHSPDVRDCRTRSNDTTVRRWLRLPWNDAVDRSKDTWLPPVVWKGLEKLLNGIDRLF